MEGLSVSMDARGWGGLAPKALRRDQILDVAQGEPGVFRDLDCADYSPLWLEAKHLASSDFVRSYLYIYRQ